MFCVFVENAEGPVYSSYDAPNMKDGLLELLPGEKKELRLQKPFSNGVSFLATYAYVKQESQWYFDEQDEYDGILTWYDFAVTQAGSSGNPTVAADPTHRFVGAATFELPFGRDRKYGSDMSGFLDAIVGGWMVSGIFTYYSGVPIVFTEVSHGELGQVALPPDVTGAVTAGLSRTVPIALDLLPDTQRFVGSHFHHSF